MLITGPANRSLDHALANIEDMVQEAGLELIPRIPKDAETPVQGQALIHVKPIKGRDPESITLRAPTLENFARNCLRCGSYEVLVEPLS